MIANTYGRFLLIVLAVSLTACGAGGYQDLDNFMIDKKSKPGGVVKPIPAFKAYKAFNYSATGLRSPFEKPVDIKDIARLEMSSNVKPDPNRAKEYLEQFGIDSLSMVGTLEQEGIRWALMQDKDGGVHRVRKGNYIGRNHGKIVEAEETFLSVMEIVAVGVGSWVERPRTIKLKSLEE